MATGTAFGPQGFQSATSLPAGVTRNRYGNAVDTWVRDCAAGDKTGTVLDAAFFNTILGNLRQLVKGANADGASISLTDGDMTLVHEAVKFYAGLNTYTVGEGLVVTDKSITIDIASLKSMIA